MTKAYRPDLARGDVCEREDRHIGHGADDVAHRLENAVERHSGAGLGAGDSAGGDDRGAHRLACELGRGHQVAHRVAREPAAGEAAESHGGAQRPADHLPAQRVAEQNGDGEPEINGETADRNAGQGLGQTAEAEVRGEKDDERQADEHRHGAGEADHLPFPLARSPAKTSAMGANVRRRRSSPKRSSRRARPTRRIHRPAPSPVGDSGSSSHGWT